MRTQLGLSWNAIGTWGGALALAVALGGCGDDDPASPDAAVTADAATDAATVDTAVPPIDAAIDGAALDCDTPLACPTPDAGDIALCGRIFDIETSDPLVAATATGTICDPGALADEGPCALELSVHDVIELLGDPNGAPGLDGAEIEYDDCGRFRLTAATPGSTFAAIRLRGVAVHPSVSVFSVPAGAQLASRELYRVRTTTEEAWSTSAELGGDSFAEAGLIVALFRHDGAPEAGVSVVSATSDITANDYYFADTEATQRTEVDAALTETGANGTALVTDRPAIDNYTGDKGSAPDGCTWPVVIGAAIPGFVLVQPFDADCAP